jgi:hypothetical protein
LGLLRVEVGERQWTLKRLKKMRRRIGRIRKKRRVRAVNFQELLKLTDELPQHGQPFHAPLSLSLPRTVHTLAERNQN